MVRLVKIIQEPMKNKPALHFGMLLHEGVIDQYSPGKAVIMAVNIVYMLVTSSKRCLLIYSVHETSGDVPDSQR